MSILISFSRFSFFFRIFQKALPLQIQCCRKSCSVDIYCVMHWYKAHRLENCFRVRGIKQYKSWQLLFTIYTFRSGGGVVVKLLACSVRFQVSLLRFQRLVITCFQVAIWLKYHYLKRRKSSKQPTQLWNTCCRNFILIFSFHLLHVYRDHQELSNFIY